MSNSPQAEDLHSRLEIFEIGEDLHLHAITHQEPSPEWLRDETKRWISGKGYDFDEIRTLCEACGIDLSPALAEVIKAPPTHPCMVGMERLLLLTYVLSQDEEERRVVVVCAPSTILTFHELDESLGEVSRDFQRERKLRIQAPLAVLVELIERALLRLNSRAFDLRAILVRQTDELEAGTLSLDSEALLGLKQQATGLEIQVEDLLSCLSWLASYDSEALKAAAARPLLVQMQASLDRALNTVARLKERIEDMHNFQVREADETTNRRLKVLTILSAIYLPATLIAGIYGMNFEHIPITHMAHGYAVVILMMALVVVGQLVFFYRRGWFK